jgi:hypothetical protein
LLARAAEGGDQEVIHCLLPVPWKRAFEN